MGVNSFISAVVHAGASPFLSPNSHTQQQLAFSWLMNLITRNVREKRTLVSFARASWAVCHFPSSLYDLQIRQNTAIYLTSQRGKIAAFRWQRWSWHIFRGVHLLLMTSFQKHIASSTFIWCTVQSPLKGTRKHANTSASTSHAHPKPLCYWIEMEPTTHFLGVLI